jgi:hypothetical protein
VGIDAVSLYLLICAPSASLRVSAFGLKLKWWLSDACGCVQTFRPAMRKPRMSGAPACGSRELFSSVRLARRYSAASGESGDLKLPLVQALRRRGGAGLTLVSMVAGRLHR